MVLSEEELEDVRGGVKISYEEAKNRSKFKDLKEEPNKEEMRELTEEELEKYLGGINMNAHEAEEFTKSL